MRASWIEGYEVIYSLLDRKRELKPFSHLSTLLTLVDRKRELKSSNWNSFSLVGHDHHHLVAWKVGSSR